jgi:hypothetical protein
LMPSFAASGVPEYPALIAQRPRTRPAGRRGRLNALTGDGHTPKEAH